MADATIKVVMDSNWEETIKTMPAVKAVVTKEAKKICDTANSLSSGFKSGIYVDKKTNTTIGNTPAQYGSMNAKVYPDRNGAGSTSVALVYTKNYAAQKDNLLHNTLTKAIGTHG